MKKKLVGFFLILILSNSFVFADSQKYNDSDANTGLILDGNVLTWDEKEFGKIILDKNTNTMWIPLNPVVKHFNFTTQTVKASATKNVSDKSITLVENKVNGTKIFLQPYDTDKSAAVSRIINNKIYVRAKTLFSEAGYTLGWSKASSLNIKGGKQNYILVHSPPFMLKGTTKQILESLPKGYAYKFTSYESDYYLTIGTVKSITAKNYAGTGNTVTYSELDAFISFSIYNDLVQFSTSSDKENDKKIVVDILESLQPYYDKDFSYIIEMMRSQEPIDKKYESTLIPGQILLQEDIKNIFEPNEQYSIESLAKNGGLIRTYTKAEKDAQEVYALTNNIELIHLTKDIIKQYDNQPSTNNPEDIIQLGYSVYDDIIVFGQKHVVEDRWGAGISQSIEDAWVSSQIYPKYDAVKVRVNLGNGSKKLTEAYIKYWSGSEADAKTMISYIEQVYSDYKAYVALHGSSEGFETDYWFVNKQFTTKNGNTFFWDFNNWYSERGNYVYIKKDFSEMVKTYYKGGDGFQGIVPYGHWVNNVHVYYPEFKWK